MKQGAVETSWRRRKWLLDEVIYWKDLYIKKWQQLKGLEWLYFYLNQSGDKISKIAGHMTIWYCDPIGRE